MKKIIFLLLTSLIWFSCSLPDSGRMAVIDFNFKQPDILKEAETQSVPDRIIPLESKTVVVVMYPSFTDSVTEDDFWTLADGQLETILGKEDTRVLYMNFGTSFTGGSLENIVPGDYSFAVYTFNTIISNTEDLLSNVFNAMTWRIKKDVTIVPGFNLVDLPLKLNDDIYLDAKTAADITPMGMGSASTGTMNFNETIYLSAVGFQPDICRITYDPLVVYDPIFSPSDIIEVKLYTEEGYLIDTVPTVVSANEVYLTFSPTSSTYKVIISARNTTTAQVGGIPIGMYFDYNNYTESPTQNLTINIYGNT